MKNNQDNQIQVKALCNIYFSNKTYVAYIGVKIKLLLLLLLLFHIRTSYVHMLHTKQSVDERLSHFSNP